jgi:hypothetical protein
MALRRYDVTGKVHKKLTEEQEQDITEAFALGNVDGSGSDSEKPKVIVRALGSDPREVISDVGEDGSDNDDSESKLITVHRLSGEPFTISFDPDWTVLHLKRALHDRGSFAPIFQKICIGTVLLENHEKLADRLRLLEILSVTMVVSLGEINLQLQSTCAHSRAKALNIISKNFSRSTKCEAVVASVRLCLLDPSAYVRRAALNALWQLAAPGDEHVIAEVSAFLDDDAGYVREAALLALGHLLRAGDERFQAAVEACLHDAEARVRCSALHKIEEVMKEHDCCQRKGKIAKGWQALVETLLSGDSR